MTDCQQLDTKRPLIPKGTHPIDTGKYIIVTNEINSLYDKVIQWVGNRIPGAVIVGRSRLGKTKSIDYLRLNLPDDLGDLFPIYHICCRYHKLANENAFFENLLDNVKHNLSTSGKANYKRKRLTNFSLERAETSGHSKLLLFMDDAQNLHDADYAWLMDINNELDRCGVSMTVLLVGPKELLNHRSGYFTTNEAQIIGRFMVQEYQFRGITTLEDLRTCLIGYDSDSEHPDKSGWSYTRYYFPESFANGYRLEEHSKDLYDLFFELKKETSKEIEIPMQYFTASVDTALRIYGYDGENVFKINKDQWREAIILAGYQSAESCRKS